MHFDNYIKDVKKKKRTREKGANQQTDLESVDVSLSPCSAIYYS